MAKRDFYEVLGVPKNASPNDLKNACRKLAMQCHPDRHPEDSAAEQRFKDVAEAYDILKDDQKRATYDRERHGIYMGRMSDWESFDDLLDAISRRSRGMRRGGNSSSEILSLFPIFSIAAEMMTQWGDNNWELGERAASIIARHACWPFSELGEAFAANWVRAVRGEFWDPHRRPAATNAAP
jgi:curved DNA-binding protein CbpA